MKRFEVVYNDGEYTSAVEVLANEIAVAFEENGLVIRSNGVTFSVNADPAHSFEIKETEISACCAVLVDERGFCTKCRDHA